MAHHHVFKPYVDFPEMCVVELPNGDTCNLHRDDHVYNFWHREDSNAN